MNVPLRNVQPVALPSDQDSSGRTLGDEEIALVTEAIRSGCLFTVRGPYGKKLQSDFAAMTGAKHAAGCNSGSAAVHCAVAAIDPEPGDEIVTTSITDMGALTPILYQGAIPVFADVCPRTGNVTAETISARITDRTKAIVVTHLFGNPCDMTGIMAVANARGIPVIEDCAQAFLAKHKDQTVGTIGAIGCFSLQQGKHITTGEGGLVTTNDPALARRVNLFVHKAWGYGDPAPDHYFLALNYRMSELQTACALGQLPKLPGVVAARVAAAARMDELLAGTPGVEVPHREPGDTHVYWKYRLRIDPKVIPGGPAALAKSLKEASIASAPRYIQKPAFRCEIFRDQRTFGNSRWPFTLARPEAVDYATERFPGTFEYLDRVLVLPWNEKYTDDHLNYLASSIYHAAKRLAGA
jgi:dTDP-4-amino-4,6-dideoxygalactose transaminase